MTEALAILALFLLWWAIAATVIAALFRYARNRAWEHERAASEGWQRALEGWKRDLDSWRAFLDDLDADEPVNLPNASADPRKDLVN